VFCNEMKLVLFVVSFRDKLNGMYFTVQYIGKPGCCCKLILFPFRRIPFVVDVGNCKFFAERILRLLTLTQCMYKGVEFHSFLRNYRIN